MKHIKKGRPVDGERQNRQRNKLINAGKALLDKNRIVKLR